MLLIATIIIKKNSCKIIRKSDQVKHFNSYLATEMTNLALIVVLLQFLSQCFSKITLINMAIQSNMKYINLTFNFKNNADGSVAVDEIYDVSERLLKETVSCQF